MDTLEILKAMTTNHKTKQIFKGVFPCDKLPKTSLRKKPACFIINTDPSFKSGTHWVAVYFSKHGRAEYFDSFGLKPQVKSILKFLSTNSSGYVYNEIQLQNILSIACGKYCCEYLFHRCSGKSRALFFKKYSTSDTIKNECNVNKNFKIHFK